LTIVGLGEDGLDGVPVASRQAIEAAEIIMGAARHIALLPEVAAQRVTWPVPFADGIAQLLSYRGKRVVMLASGDPFWYGAGTSIAKHLTRGEWVAHPVASTFSLAASRLGWALQETQCMGLHAAPLTRLRPHLHGGARMILTLRDGAAVSELAEYLRSVGFGGSTLSVLEALGGPRERRHDVSVAEALKGGFSHPLVVGVTVEGAGGVIPLASGRPDDLFDNDGQITKRPVRALTLSALAPRPHEHLWDIGGGSGSIGIEWLWAHPSLRASAVEINAERADRIRENAAQLGADRLQVITGAAPAVLGQLEAPDAVFIGGGISEEMLDEVWARMPAGARLVANAVTLEAEVLLALWHADKGGQLLRIELAESKPLGRKRGWKSSYPIVQWSVVK
jgi:precorrin-6Y C5,15-methyltransferase (decarboxylating)